MLISSLFTELEKGSISLEEFKKKINLELDRVESEIDYQMGELEHIIQTQD
jgi:hypothetical protein